MDLDFIKVLSSSKSLLGSPKLEIVSLSSLKHWFYLMYLTNVSSFSNDLLPEQNHIRLFYVQVDMLDSPMSCQLLQDRSKPYTLSVCHRILALYFCVLQKLEVHSWWGWRSLNCRVLSLTKVPFWSSECSPTWDKREKQEAESWEIKRAAALWDHSLFCDDPGAVDDYKSWQGKFPYSNLPWWPLCASGSCFVWRTECINSLPNLRQI